MREIDDATAHKENIRAHAARRFRERFHQELTPKMRSTFFRQIESGYNAWLVSIQKGKFDRSECEIYFLYDKSVSKDPIVAVFRRDWMEIVTFMTPEFYKNQITGALAEERRKIRLRREKQERLGAPVLRDQPSEEAAS